MKSHRRPPTLPRTLGKPLPARPSQPEHSARFEPPWSPSANLKEALPARPSKDADPPRHAVSPLSVNCWKSDTRTGRWVLTQHKLRTLIDSAIRQGKRRGDIRRRLRPLCLTIDLDVTLLEYFKPCGKLHQRLQSRLDNPEDDPITPPEDVASKRVCKPFRRKAFNKT